MSGCSFDSDNCGTGLVGGSIPKPGDPDNFGTISARGILGGIRVIWGYPLLNAHAVAHIKVFRGTSSQVEQATEIATTNANYYEDMFGIEERTYYYWIQYVSVQGTAHELIGPAWATSFSSADGYIEALHERINQGVLSQELQKEIDRIRLNKLGIDQEMIDRAANDETLGVKFDEIKAYTDDTRAAIQEEALARSSADEAFASTVSTLYADLEGNIAAVQNEKLARVTADEALAGNINTVESTLGSNLAQAEEQLETKINAVDGTVQSMYTVKLNSNGLIGGFGLVNNSKEIEAGFDVDTFWIGSSRYNQYKPFIVDHSGVYLNGKVTFSNVENGPPADADHTGSNTSNDTNYVAGETAWKVKSNAEKAEVAKARVDGWTKPWTTSIDGNKIHTGDAYVDTLQIKNRAVTVAQYSLLAMRRNVFHNTTEYIGSIFVDHPGKYDGGTGCIIFVNLIGRGLGGDTDWRITVRRSGWNWTLGSAVYEYSQTYLFTFFDSNPPPNPYYSVDVTCYDYGGGGHTARVHGSRVMAFGGKR